MPAGDAAFSRIPGDGKELARPEESFPEYVARIILKPTFYSVAGKRWLDVSAALAGLTVVSPLLVAVAIAIRLTSRGPVFFRQVRTGRDGKTFEIAKFRTLAPALDSGAFPIPAAEDLRITPLGRWLRKTKIDELPQLFNVLCGEMSLVGPRPELPCYTAHYDAKQQEVFRVKPGMTSPASIAFAREEDLLAAQQDRAGYYLKTILPAKLALDVAYSRNVRMGTDLRILLQTFTRLLIHHPAPVLAEKGLSESHEEMV